LQFYFTLDHRLESAIPFDGKIGGALSHLHLIGGGPMAPQASEMAIANGWSCSLRTSTRWWNAQAEWARAFIESGSPVFCDDALDVVMRKGPKPQRGDVALSLGSPWIFSQEWIAQWHGNAFNCHSRRLPETRGGGGATWLILMQERQGMAAIHELTGGLDKGPLVATQTFFYPESARIPDDFNRIDNEQNKRLLASWLEKVLKGQPFERMAQAEHLSLYYPRISSDIHAWIDWSWDIDEIATFVEAFDRPYPGAKTFARGKQVNLRTVGIATRRANHPFLAGLITRIEDSTLCVAVKGGTLTFADVTSKGESIKISVGDRFVTPSAMLERARATRVQFLPSGELKTASVLPEDLPIR
jgi:methionyl-tRNA formyltransferase